MSARASSSGSGGDDQPSLVRAIGTAGIAAGIVNITIGGGIFKMPAITAGMMGASAPLAFLVCSVVIGLIVMCFAEAGKRVDLTGGPYAYVEVAFGPFAGFVAGILVWLVGSMAVAAVSTVLADAIVPLVPGLRAAGDAGRAVFIASLFGALGAINVIGVKQGSRLNGVLAAAKLVPLFVLIVGGLFVIDPANLRLTEPVTAASVARGSVMLIFAFCGIEGAMVPSGEFRDVRHTVPRAIALAMLTITTVYVAVQIVAQGMLGSALPQQALPLSAAAAAVFGPWGGHLLLLGAAVSMLGSMSGMTLAMPRALYAFGRDGFLPGALAQVHPRFRTPHWAIAAQTLFVVSLAVTSGFERLTILTNIGILVLYALCCVAAWRLAALDPAVPRWRAALVPVAACAAITYLLSGVTWAEWKVALLLLAGSGAIYLLRRRRVVASATA